MQIIVRCDEEIGGGEAFVLEAERTVSHVKRRPCLGSIGGICTSRRAMRSVRPSGAAASNLAPDEKTELHH